jgi:hypothetical protein
VINPVPLASPFPRNNSATGSHIQLITITTGINIFIPPLGIDGTGPRLKNDNSSSALLAAKIDGSKNHYRPDIEIYKSI